MLNNIIQLVIVVLVIGGPILGRVLQAMDKQRKERQKQKVIEAGRHEALRTGQTVEASTAARSQRPPPAAQLQELQRRRQQQLEELRRRQQAARQTQTAPHPAPIARPTTPSTTVRQPGRQAGPRPPGPQTPRSRPQPARPRPQSVMPPPLRPAPRPANPVPQTTESDTPTTSIHELRIDPHVAHPITQAAVAPVKIMGQTMSARDWRRLVVARELLGPPLALRDPGRGLVG